MMTCDVIGFQSRRPASEVAINAPVSRSARTARLTASNASDWSNRESLQEPRPLRL